jgi:hypothetical protein
MLYKSANLILVANNQTYDENIILGLGKTVTINDDNSHLHHNAVYFGTSPLTFGGTYRLCPESRNERQEIINIRP